MIIDCGHPVPPDPALQWQGPGGPRVFCPLCARVRLVRPEPDSTQDPLFAAAADLYALAHNMDPEDLDLENGADLEEISMMAVLLRSQLQDLRS